MSNQHSTAFPAQAAQDNFGKIFTPFPGFTKYEYVLLQFALTGVKEFIFDDFMYSNKEIADFVMLGAKELADAYFSALQKDKDNSQPLSIIK